MNTAFTAIDEMIIRNSMLYKSHKDIAELIGCDIAPVASFISYAIAGTGIVTKQMLINQKRVIRPKTSVPKKISSKKIEKEWALQKEQKKVNIQEKIEHDRKQLTAAYLARKSFKTKQVDLTKLVSVKIDDKTSIFIKPGEDAKKAVEKFYKNRLYQKTTEEIY